MEPCNQFTGHFNALLLARRIHHVNSGWACFDAKLPAFKEKFVKTEEDEPRWNDFLTEIRKEQARFEFALKQMLWLLQQTQHDMDTAMQFFYWQRDRITFLTAYGNFKYKQLCTLNQTQCGERWSPSALGACYI